MATILGPVQHTELCPASWILEEGLNTNHIKVFFNRVWDGFSQHFTGLDHRMVQAPGWGVQWEGTWPLSSMAPPW